MITALIIVGVILLAAAMCCVANKLERLWTDDKIRKHTADMQAEHAYFEFTFWKMINAHDWDNENDDL
jgi:hypothetical protein